MVSLLLLPLAVFGQGQAPLPPVTITGNGVLQNAANNYTIAPTNSTLAYSGASWTTPTNTVGTNVFEYYTSTNVVGAGTNWLVYTNPNPGVISAYVVELEVFGTCPTNPALEFFLQHSMFTVTNGTTTTGCAVTNSFVAASKGAGLPASVIVSNSLIGSPGYGITLVGAVTNTMAWIARLKQWTP